MSDWLPRARAPHGFDEWAPCGRCGTLRPEAAQVFAGPLRPGVCVDAAWCSRSVAGFVVTGLDANGDAK